MNAVVCCGAPESDTTKVYLPKAAAPVTMPVMFTKPGVESGSPEPSELVTIGVMLLTVDAETLYGGVPPVISTLIVLPLHATTDWLLGVASSAGPGAVGGAPVPTTFSRVAVVCSPIASTIVNTSGLTHEPLVMTLNGCPLAATVELSRVTELGKVELIR